MQQPRPAHIRQACLPDMHGLASPEARKWDSQPHLHQVQMLYQARADAVGLRLAGHHSSVCNDDGYAHIQRGMGQQIVLVVHLWSL